MATVCVPVQVRRGGRSSASRNGSSAEDEAGAEEAAEGEEEVEGEAEAEASRSAGEARSSRRARHHDLSSPSPSRKQPRRQVTPRSYRDLLRFESDSDEASGAEADGGGGREPAPEPKKTPQSHGNAHYTPVVVGGWRFMNQTTKVVT